MNVDPQKIWNDFMSKSVHETGYWYSSFTSTTQAHIDFPELAKWLVTFLLQYKNQRIYDFGCGNAYYLQQLHDNDIKNLIGIEVECPVKNTPFQVLPYNLAFDLPLTEKGIVISFEVGEHIPQKYQDKFIDNISKLCNSYLILSWAIVDQPGIGHVNCKNNDEVVKLFEEKDFTYQKDLTEDIRNCSFGQIDYFKNTLLIFKKNES
jgi:hypothetical protein